MNSSAQQTKPKLKYKICGETTQGYAFPKMIHATVSLQDETTRILYDNWSLNQRVSNYPDDTKVCFLTIGIRRN